LVPTSEHSRQHHPEVAAVQPQEVQEQQQTVQKQVPGSRRKQLQQSHLGQ
jgi:hypothetical protein